MFAQTELQQLDFTHVVDEADGAGSRPCKLAAFGATAQYRPSEAGLLENSAEVRSGPSRVASPAGTRVFGAERIEELLWPTLSSSPGC